MCTRSHIVRASPSLSMYIIKPNYKSADLLSFCLLKAIIIIVNPIVWFWCLEQFVNKVVTHPCFRSYLCLYLFTLPKFTRWPETWGADVPTVEHWELKLFLKKGCSCSFMVNFTRCHGCGITAVCDWALGFPKGSKISGRLSLSCWVFSVVHRIRVSASLLWQC